MYSETSQSHHEEPMELEKLPTMVHSPADAQTQRLASRTSEWRAADRASRTSEWKAAEWKEATFIVDHNYPRSEQKELQVEDIATPLTSRPSLGKKKRPMSAIFTASRFSSRKSSDGTDRRASLQAMAVNVTANTEQIRQANTEAAAPPEKVSRRSSFAPGVATRTEKRTCLESSAEVEEESHQVKTEQDLVNADQQYYYNPQCSVESPLGQLEVLEFDEEWQPPPQSEERASTPSDLDYHYLGGLRLGSLTVTNGRVSPAPSELSRHLNFGPPPGSRRDVSSEYGDSEGGGPIALAEVRRVEVDDQIQHLARMPMNRRDDLDPSTDFDPVLTPGRQAASTENPVVHTPITSHRTSIDTKDIEEMECLVRSHTASMMADEYIAELSASPFGMGRSPSPSSSVIITRSKANEFDDALFEDDNPEPSSSEEADRVTLDTHYSSGDDVSIHEEPLTSRVQTLAKSFETATLKPTSSTNSNNSTGSSKKIDSGYGSSLSLQQANTVSKESSREDVGATAQRNIPITAETVKSATPKMVEERRPGPRPLPPSILKLNSTSNASLPIFSNLYSSTSSLTSNKSATSLTNEKDPATKSRKLSKLRPRSQPPPLSRQITVSGQHDHADFDIPVVPAELTANLALRQGQVPELEHTYRSMHHTRERDNSASSIKRLYGPTEISFPTPNEPPYNIQDGGEAPTTSSRRSSFMKWSKSEKRSSLSMRRSSGASGISERDAMAIIQDFGVIAGALGNSPYDIASNASRPTTPSNPNQITPRSKTTRPEFANDMPRQKSMMDDEQAAEVTRRRNKARIERENFESSPRRSSFNDRGGIPGRNMRRISMAHDAPPLPPMPTLEEVRQREMRKADRKRPCLETPTTEKNYCIEEPTSDSYSSPTPPPPCHSAAPMQVEAFEKEEAPPPPSHSPRPMSINISGVQEDCGDPPPPPPSHSPRPMSAEPSEDLPPPPPSHLPRPISSDAPEVVDPWAAQAEAWKSRRRSLGAILHSQTSSSQVQNESPSSWPQEQEYEEPIYPEIPLRRPRSAFGQPQDPYQSQYIQSPVSYHEFCQQDHERRPRPSQRQSYNSYINTPDSRAHSRHSQNRSQGPSRAGSYVSLAEELQTLDEPPSVPKPQFGRYSGGMNYGYEHGNGFGGSSGTRSVSSFNKAARKSGSLSEGYGIDLSDVPIMAQIRRKPVA